MNRKPVRPPSGHYWRVQRVPSVWQEFKFRIDLVDIETHAVAGSRTFVDPDGLRFYSKLIRDDFRSEQSRRDEGIEGIYR